MASEVIMWGARRRRKRRDGVDSELERASGAAAVSGLYVDVENLQEQGFAQRFLVDLAANWPGDVPPLGVMRLYVRADMRLIWEMWADGRFPDVEVGVKGVQHFSSASKNSADIALSLDAICDLVMGSVQHIVVVSDDSDFAALFGKVRELRGTDGGTPFLWIMTNRKQTRSHMIEAFSPNIYIRNMDFDGQEPPYSDRNGRVGAAELAQSALAGSASGVPTNDDVARAIIHDIDVGLFRSVDCHAVVRRRWPASELAGLDGARFGNHVVDNIMPIMKKYGVTRNPSSKKYEMTENAKRQLRARAQLDRAQAG